MNNTPKILYEDDDLLVINKPAGLLTHARSLELLHQEPTVVDWLIEKDPSIQMVGDDPKLRPGLVHRLDKETSGVMVIAKTSAAFVHLKQQFHDKEVKKEYRAWVYGKMPTDWGEIKFPIGRAEEGGRMASRPLGSRDDAGQTGQAAVTEYEVLDQKPNRALIKVMPKTGRTHQIRVHFFAFNHPVIGDPLYKIKRYKEIPTERMLLHAYKLTFKNLAGEEKIFSVPVPEEFDI